MLVAGTIVVSLSAVGNILVVAMLVTPAAAARLLTDHLLVMLGLSAGIGVTSGVIGLFVSYHTNVAAGATIVLVATALFGAVWLLAPVHGLVAAASRVGTRRCPSPRVGPWSSSPGRSGCPRPANAGRPHRGRGAAIPPCRCYTLARVPCRRPIPVA